MAANLKGYGCEFFERIPELFKCHVCSLVLRDPHLTKCCHKNICLHCAENDECRLCGAPGLVGGSLNRRLREEILQQMVYCRAKHEGCGWSGILEKLDEHDSKCGFVSVDCSCGTSFQRKDESEHKKVCHRFPVTCHCGDEVERWLLSDHKKDCPLEHVKCPFHSVGCTAVIPNKRLEAHFRQDLSAHVALVSKQTSEVQKQWKQAKTRKEASEKKINERLDAEIARLSVSIATADEKASELAEQLKHTEEEVRQMTKQTAREMNNFARSRQANDMEVREIERRVATLRLGAQMKCLGPPLPRPLCIKSRPTSPCKDEHLVPFTFLINNFSDLNALGILIYSPPFYTRRRGYKMCLKVYCNGCDNGKGKFLAIYVQLLKGEYDHKLKWPFNGTFTVVVLNQLTTNTSDVHHKSRKITFDQTTDSTCEARAQVLTGYLAKEWIGFWNFVPLSILFPISPILPTFKYVVNNSLKIQVSNFD